MLAAPRTFKGAERSATACGVTNNVLNTAANVRTVVRLHSRVDQPQFLTGGDKQGTSFWYQRPSVNERFT